MNRLAKKVVRKLIVNKKTISVSESCTGGLLSSVITSINDSSKVFKFGIVSYSNESKNTLLKIPKSILKKYGTVSENVCLNMVKNINKINKTNISLAITGIAGPKGGTKKKPVGLVYIAIKSGNKSKVTKHFFEKKNRINIQKAAVNQSLRLILKFVR